MKYKDGDKIQIKSWNQLVSEIENGLEFKLKKFSSSIKHDNIFSIPKYKIDLISNEKKVTIKSIIDNNTFTIVENYILGYEYIFPIEFIKEKIVFKLPDELFKME